jgi:hypothetical protein
MGRGNTCVFGEYEGLFYIDWDNFSNEYEDEHGNIIQDYDLQREEWENSLDEFISDFTRKFKSFSKCNEWISRDEKAILENKLFYIAITDNEWSMAIKLIQKEQGYYNPGNIENLQAKHYKTYLEGIKECLFNQFEELGTYGGAWTSGRICRCGGYK